MTGIFIIFMIVILLMLLILMIAVGRHRDDSCKDDPYVNEEGDHLYYDRGLIEKKEFHKRHPDINGIRTLRRLFGYKSKEKA